MGKRRIVAISLVVIFILSTSLIFVYSDSDDLSPTKEFRYGTDPFNPDTDGDGLSDSIEINKYETDPTKSDSDGDGLDDGEEVTEYETDPLEKDTDMDGLNDGEETTEYNTDPIAEDTDGDGLDDGEEVNKYDTNPLEDDTDGDGLRDSVEVNKYDTDPLVEDSDGDRLNDGEEVTEYDTDPLAEDTDGDGLDDGEEVKEYNTDPLIKDTDNDELTDGKEINEYNTDPIAEDTDGDGLDDGEEVNEYNTDPLEKDSDEDSVPDELELEYGTDPTSKPDCLGNTSADTHSDFDGVNDRKECLYGLDKTEEDTDGDGLSDWEELNGETREGTTIEDSNPTQKDVYLRIGLTEGTEIDAEQIKDYYEDLPVENPNGTEGIDVHYTVKEYDEEVVYSENSFESIQQNYKDSLIEQDTFYRGILIVTDEHEEYDGYAQYSGRFAIVADGNEVVAYHEIMHLLLGDIENDCTDDEGHICSEDGLMNSTIKETDLSDSTIEILNNSDLNGVN